MITVDNLKKVLEELHYIKKKSKNIYEKRYDHFDCVIKVDFGNKKIVYPEDKGMKIHRKTTCNFSENENFVVLECITSLLDKGYKPSNIELEKPMPGGHEDTGGYCDIQVKDNNDKTFLLIECKKEDEFEKYWKKTLVDGGQLFRYYNSYRQAKALCMYMSDYSGKIKRYTNIISMTDNEEYLQTNNTLRSFKQVQLDNGNKEDYFKVWRDTYQSDYATSGLFEEDIEPYTIGKAKYSIADLREVDNDAIQKKYHEFATILRQHNVGSHENAFDKLVNLFLAKIVDETINPTELQFYWKGAACDDYYSLQDRLQKLYKEGMEKFLGEEVAYIDQKQVAEAFHLFRNDPDATKNKILDYFRQLKFYTNSDFAFLDVHNKELFYQNAEILKKMVKMLENIKLRTDKHNQFLGDLFEGFLDDGVKQSEGQYFTPLPIVKFIINSLPIKEIISNNESVPKVIDYACGAGHFLTEYASCVKGVISDTDLNEYYKNVYGIEKEYRLSKVAKVSCFMYGFDDIQIVYGDALITQKKIKDEDYSVLIANPPYSVKGFLEVLGEDRKKYELANYVSDVAKNNSIETFFIERAKQLLAGDGIAAIILPISILTTKDNLYAACRDIILKYFDIVAISEFSSGTFYKTPTNTVVLFLRKKNDNPDLSEHYLNRVEAWFAGDDSKDAVFDDYDSIDKYCNHCEISTDEYISWIQGGEIPHSEIFEKYMKEIVKGAKYKNILKRKITTRFSAEDKENLLEEYIDNYIKDIEKEKLYYYLLVSNNSMPVVISKTPTKNTELKKFLGYEWSGEKGKEGIKYLNQVNEDEEDSLSLNRGINGIITPLFNPNEHDDETKICNLIRENYNMNEPYIPEELHGVVSIYNLEDLIDFSKVTFNKAIRTSAPRKLVVKSKYPVSSISKECSKINPSKTEISTVKKDTMISFVPMDSVSCDGRIEKKEEKRIGDLDGSYTYFRDNDVIIAKITPCMENGKCALAKGLKNGIGLGSSEFHVFRSGKKIIPEYLFEYLNRDIIRQHAQLSMTGASGHRRVPIDFYEDLPIPVPPKKIQKNIFDECKKLTEEYYSAYDENQQILNEISTMISKESGEKSLLEKVSSYVTERISYTDIDEGSYISTNNMLQDFKGIKESKGVPVADKIIQYRKGDILVSNIRPYLKKIWIADRDGGCSPDVLVFRVIDEEKVLPKYLYYLLRQQAFFDWMMRSVTGMKMPRADKDNVMLYDVVIPDAPRQEKMLEIFKPKELTYQRNLEVIKNYSDKKNQVLIEKLELKEMTL